MTKIATATFTETDVPLPAGFVPAGRKATLFLSNLPVGTPIDVEVNVPFTFTIDVPGSYHVEVARVDANGVAGASPAASDPFVIAADTMSVPVSVTVVLSDPTMTAPDQVTVTQ